MINGAPIEVDSSELFEFRTKKARRKGSLELGRELAALRKHRTFPPRIESLAGADFRSREEHVMKIGIIGAGNIGGTLTRRFRELGHEVSVANSRGPETLKDLAAETGAKPVTVQEAAKSGE